MNGVPISRATGQIAKTPYRVGFETGSEGCCFYSVSYSKAAHRDEYRAGWLKGYREALTAEVEAYNAAHGTAWEPRL